MYSLEGKKATRFRGDEIDSRVALIALKRPKMSSLANVTSDMYVKNNFLEQLVAKLGQLEVDVST